jgi:DNA-binding transcriptional regulator YdaS (Cro superfamily)
MDSVQFLDAVRARHRIPSDNKLAQFLGLPQPRVTSYRTGRRKLDPDACLAVAKALELPPEHVFASVAAERAKRTEHRRVWERLAKIAKNAGAAVVVGFVATTATPPSARAQSNGADSVYSVKWRRWFFRLADRRRVFEPVPPRHERRHHERRRGGRPSRPAALAA